MRRSRVPITKSTPEPPLAHRGSLTHWQGIALYVGAVLGTGIIGLPAIAARTAGPASLVAWAGLVLLSLPLAATFAELGARFPDAGGVSTYVRRAFGPRAAAATGWWFYFAIPVGSPAAGLFAGSYVAEAAGGGRVTVLAVAAGLVVVTGAANLFGVRVSGRLQLVLAAVLLGLIVVASAVSLPHASVSNLRPFAPKGWLAVGSAAALLVWGFAGWEAIAHLAAEFARPRVDLRRAAGAAVVVVAVAYLAVAAATILVLGPAAGRTDAPLAVLLEIGLGGPAKAVAAGMAVVLTLGVMNAYYAAAAKLGAALGRDGALPQWFARGSEAGSVPRRSLGVLVAMSSAALGAVALLGTDVRPLVRITTASLVAVYALGIAAAVRLLASDRAARRVAVAAAAAVGIMLFATGAYLASPVVVAIAALLYQRRSHRASSLDAAQSEAA